ncbi:hypothetical protein AWB64_02007 [Caballeronia sordidicola]|uniref:Uncharacterized protein n=1 Tax=Caballeronia sordidicola TaxID=196367 RepID=A0A158FZP3_CABSO|nr:hypothetical protein [Caballeronia sordidicola]SAL25107.1 hypothetical protein AWB64_02007 [Caballeronia sordidicola]
MIKRHVMVYYAWSRPAENGAPLHVIEDRFPALFESRRMGFPRFHEFSNVRQFDQSIAGFLDHIMKRNFTDFVELAKALTGQSVTEIERVTDDETLTPLDANLLSSIDTLIVISFDSLRTAQTAGSPEIEALRTFLGHPDHLAFICPHHDIGDVTDLPENDQLQRQIAEFEHHGDKTIPPRQRFGGFARSLLAGLGVPVENRFGLRPAPEADGTPAPIERDTTLDRLGILQNVSTFNLHPHLPQLERLGETVDKLDVLARQRIDPTAPQHPFTRERATFDALLQSRADTFAGSLLVSDTTLWSSTAGGVDSLRELWTNVLQRPLRS